MIDYFSEFDKIQEFRNFNMKHMKPTEKFQFLPMMEDLIPINGTINFFY